MGAIMDDDPLAQRDDHDLPFAGRVAFAFGGLIVVFCASLLAMATAALWIGTPVWRASTPLAVVLTMAVAIVWARRISPNRSATVAAVLLAGSGLTIVSSAAVGGAVLDTSFDGQWYHQEAIVRLVQGWNPIRLELSPADYGDDRSRRQLNGYPKASWLWGSAMVRSTGRIEHAKALSIPLMAAAVAAAFAGLFGLARLPWWLALGTAVVAAANPVTITQTLNTQLDGDLVSLLLIAVSCLVICGRTRCRHGPVVLALAIAVGVNLKLTAPAYFALLMAGGLLVGAIVGPRQVLRPLVAVLALAFIIGMAVIGFHPYVTNTLRHGHPLYPVLGPEKSILIPVAESNRAVLLLRSVFSPSRQFPQAKNVDLEFVETPLKVPFTVDPSEVRVFAMPDVRGGGWGPLFGGLCLLGMASLVAISLRGTRWLAMGLAITLPILISVLIIPHPWFARFVPQGWWLPLVTVPLAWAAGGRLPRTLSILALVTACANVLLVTAGYVPATIQHSALIKDRLEKLRLLGQPLELNLSPYPSNRARLAEMGIAFTRVHDPRSRLQLVLGRFPPKMTAIWLKADDGVLDLEWNEVPQATHYRVAALLPPPAGPGGGALSGVQRSYEGRAAALPVGNGELRVLLSPCNDVGCGPPIVSEPVTVTGVRRSVPLIGHPEDGATVAGPRVLLSWLPVELGNTIGEANSPITYRIEVEHADSREIVATGSTEGVSYPVHLAPSEDWIARIDVVDAKPPRQSRPVNFQTSDPVGPEIVHPAKRSTLMEGEIELRWFGVASACGYEYFVTIPGHRRPAARGTTASTSASISLRARRESATTYHAIVRARFCEKGSHSMDFWGPWSSEVGCGPAEFTVLPADLPAPLSR